MAAIYETVKAINKKLLETEGLDQEFNDVTEEEMQKFKSKN